MPTAALRDNQIAFECTFVAHSLLLLPNTYPAYKDSAFDSVKTLYVALYLIQSMPLIVMLSYFEQHTGSNAHRYASHKQLPDVPELLHELLRSVLKVFVFIIVIWKSAAISLQKMHEMRCKMFFGVSRQDLFTAMLDSPKTYKNMCEMHTLLKM